MPRPADIIIIDSDDDIPVASPLKPAVKPQLRVDDSGAILISDEEDGIDPNLQNISSQKETDSSSNPATKGSSTLRCQFEDMALHCSHDFEDNMPEVAIDLGHLTMSSDNEVQEPQILGQGEISSGLT